MIGEMPDIETLLRRATTRLDASASPRLDAEVLLAHSLGRPRSHLHAHPEARPRAAQRDAYEKLVTRRAEGEPVAYLIGRREFWSLDLHVAPATLIPRPESELLVSTALGFLLSGMEASVADLGTGCGAIALAIASERPCATVWASDISQAALTVASRNRDRLGIRNLRFVTGSWYDALPAGQRFELLVSNPPYVRAGDQHLSQGDVRFEPHAALVSGTDGLDAIRVLAAGARRRLQPGGVLIVEHGADQAQEVLRLLASSGLARARTLTDLAGRPRVCLAHA